MRKLGGQSGGGLTGWPLKEKKRRETKLRMEATVINKDKVVRKVWMGWEVKEMAPCVGICRSDSGEK